MAWDIDIDIDIDIIIKYLHFVQILCPFLQGKKRRKCSYLLKKFDMILELKSSAKELKEVASGKRKVITREIRPNTERRFVSVNDAEEITGILEYEALLLTCDKMGASITVEVENSKLWEIEDENGELIYYDWKGEKHQLIQIDYELGAILDMSGNFPNV